MSKYLVDDIDQIYGELPPLWQLTKLDELLNLNKADLQTGPFGTMLHASSYKEQGTPVLAVQHIGNNLINHSPDIPRVDKETFKRLARYEIKENDIIFCRKGAVERVALVTESEDGWLQGSDCIRLRIIDTSLFDSKFFSYVFCSQSYKRWIMRHAHGATMPSLNQTILGLSPIPLPSIEEQKEIVNILSLLDRKIDTLRKQNDTLEKIAQTLFKHWFVDFEFPFDFAQGKPSTDGKPYKSSGGEMVPSELGEIPAGWRVGVLEDMGKIVCGKTPSKKRAEFYGGDIPFIKIPDMHNKIFVGLTSEYLSVEGSESQSTKLIPAYSISVSCIATVGVVAINTKPSHTNQQINSIVLNQPHCLEFLFLHCKGISKTLELIGSGGSATLNVNTGIFSRLPLVIPSSDVTSSFHEILKPFFKKIEVNSSHIQTLTITRDTLLPKLMSGKLRVGASQNE